MTAKLLPTQQHKYVITTPIGKLGLTIANKKLVKIQFLPPSACLRIAKNSGARQIVIKIKKYFCNPSFQFKLPIKTEGTLLQQKIWNHLKKIPCGKTVTYGELAQKIGTNPRVIGNACRHNPIPIVIPCHRVVAKTKLGGYCGKANKNFLKIKRWLLEHENKK